ncbi:MAG: hypothetical protein R3F38_19155 [Gammaproteobacteria bacterium]
MLNGVVRMRSSVMITTKRITNDNPSNPHSQRSGLGKRITNTSS